MKALPRILMIAVLTTASWGCEVSKPVTRRSEMLGTRKLEKLLVTTRDSLVIRATRYQLLDSTLALEGLMQHGTRWEPFKDTVRLTDIAYVLTTRNDGFKGIVAVAAVGFVLYRTVEPLMGAGSVVTITPHTHYQGPYSSGGGSGSSCPFVYSWTGERYALDGEAYAMAWGRQLEMNTTTMLRSAPARGGTIRVRIANERPETHYTNTISMRVAVVDQGTTVVPDRHGVLWPVSNPIPPTAATGGDGEDALKSMICTDGDMWESRLGDIGPGAAFVDRVELRFPRTSRAGDGMLVLHAMNTEIFGTVLQNIGDLLGEEILPFVRALDADTGLASTLRQWTDDASLKVDVWDGSGWKRAGALLPEANVAEFTRAVHFDDTDPGAPDLRVRLTALSGVWKLDAAAVEWNSLPPVPAREIRAAIAVDETGQDVRAIIQGNDASRVTVLPGGWIDLAFACPEPGPGKSLVCALDVRGYLHEWLPPARAISPLAALVPDGSRLSLVKTLLHARATLLPPLYTEWTAFRRRTRG